MLRVYFAFVISGIAPALAFSTATDAPCSIQRAAAKGTHVWLLCDQKDLLISKDQGLTWHAKQLPTELGLRTITFLDERRGFIAGDEGTLFASDDGGETWRKVALPVQQNLTSIHFVGELGWLAGWTGVILHSTDGGRNWQVQQSGIQQGLDSIFFADPEHGWAVGWNGAVIRTVDGGHTWEKVPLPDSAMSLDSVYFKDAARGWTVGFGGRILASSDGGKTWKEQPAPLRTWMKWITFDRKGRGWIAADNALLTSEDGGDTWKSVAVDGQLFVAQVLPVSDQVWAIGQLQVQRETTGAKRFLPVAISPPESQTPSHTN